MKVLVATEETQGKRDNDFFWCQEGELVKFGVECDRDKHDIDGDCGCRRSMVGFKSHKGTTTFKVAERTMSRKRFITRLRASEESAGWKSTPREIRYNAIELLDLAEQYEVGTVLEKRGSEIQVRVEPDA